MHRSRRVSLAVKICICMNLLICSRSGAQDEFGKLPRDQSKPVATKAELVRAWQKRQGLIKTFRFDWIEQQTHFKGWLSNPRFPEREWSAIPALLIDRSYRVNKALSVDGQKMRYSFEIDREEEPDGIEIKAPQGENRGLGVRRHYSYLSVFDGHSGKTRLTSQMGSPPAVLHQAATNVDAQNLDTRTILMTFRPLDRVMGHLLMDRAVTNQGRRFYKGRSTMILEERHDPSGWKTSLWIEPERDFLVSRYRIAFEQKLMVDIDIDYVEASHWGWIPNGWRVREMLADGTSRLVAEAKVSRYSINQPIDGEQFQ